MTGKVPVFMKLINFEGGGIRPGEGEGARPEIEGETAGGI
jgi:hypothetical protein